MSKLAPIPLLTICPARECERGGSHRLLRQSWQGRVSRAQFGCSHMGEVALACTAISTSCLDCRGHRRCFGAFVSARHPWSIFRGRGKQIRDLLYVCMNSIKRIDMHLCILSLFYGCMNNTRGIHRNVSMCPCSGPTVFAASCCCIYTSTYPTLDVLLCS